MSCEHLRSAVGAYALGALDPDEAAAVRRHLETCAECAAEHDALAPLPGLLSLAGGAEQAVEKPLVAGLRGASARRLRARPRRVAATRRLKLAPAAPPLAGCRRRRRRGRPGDRVRRPRRSPARTSRRRGYDLTFRNVAAPQGTVAKADLESTDEGTRVQLSIRGLPPDEDAVYEVLCDAEPWTATAGTLPDRCQGPRLRHRHDRAAAGRVRPDPHRPPRAWRRRQPYKRDILTANLS